MMLGCHVIATARRPEALAELSDLGLSTVVLDVNDQDSIDEAKAQVETMTGGKLDVLVNNACVPNYLLNLTPPWSI